VIVILASLSEANRSWPHRGKAEPDV